MGARAKSISGSWSRISSAKQPVTKLRELEALNLDVADSRAPGAQASPLALQPAAAVPAS